MKIGKARKTEYENIQKFLEDVYGHSRGYFPRAYPHVWRKKNTDFDNILVIREKGKIVSLVRIFPLRFIFGKMRLYAGGIGAVSTDPACRGKGYMSVLMNGAARKMQESGYAVSVLGGDRCRYGNFGFENGGQCFSVAVNARGLARADGPAVSVRRYLGEKETLEEIRRCHDALDYRVERTRKDLAALYEKQGIEIYHAGTGRSFAYAVVSGEIRGDRVVESGGDSRTLLGILKYLHVRFGVGTYYLDYPGPESAPAEIMNCAGSWEMHDCGMLKIVGLQKTLESYRALIEESLPDGAAITLRAPEETVCLQKKGGRLYMGNSPAGETVTLNDPELVRLLFSLSFWPPPGVSPAARGILKTTFPLPFFWCPLDRI